MSWLIAGTQKNKGLLDEFTGAAAAYSLRDLTFLRGGPVVRVRRSSDNTEQDFTATQVTDGTLTTFCGAGNGFVRTWYDQSGNGLDMQQAVSERQPQIVTSGVLSVEINAANRPSMLFDGFSGNRFLMATINSITKLNVSVFAVGRVENYAQSYPNAGTFIAQNLLLGSWLLGGGGGGITQSRAGSQGNVSTLISSPGPYLMHVSQNSTAAELNINDFTQATTNTALTNYNANQDFKLGRVASGTDCLNGSIMEIVFFSPNVTVNQAAIRSNINAHYSIY